MIIRQYQMNDLEPLTQLMGELGYPSNIEIMGRRLEIIHASPMYYTFVAEEKHELVGMIGVRQLHSYEADGVVTQISVLVTKKEHRGKGIGRELIRFVEEWAVENGLGVIVVTSGIKEDRLKAHEFYKSIGFEITGYRFVKKIM